MSIVRPKKDRNKNYHEKLNIGDKLTLCVEGFGSKGNAFCKVNGFVIFIDAGDIDLKKQDVVNGIVTSIKPNFAFAKICEE